MLRGAQTGAVTPGVTWLRVRETTELFRGMKAEHGVTLTCGGRSLTRVDGRERVLGPGALGLVEPGQIHRNVRREGPGSFQIVSFDARLVDEARATLGTRAGTLATDAVDPHDERRAAFERLHALVLEGSTDRFALDVAVAEALAAFGSFLGSTAAPPAAFQPSVRRARAFLLDHVTEDVTLEAVAEHARADRFHLCRAFSREIGFPPYAFLTQVRIARVRAMLRRGVRASEAAQLVGFCDQSQMHRHFVRIVGCTPGAYARMS